MNIDEILQNPAFKSFDQKRMQLLKNVYLEMKGKNQMEQFAILMKHSKSLSEAKPIHKDEQEHIIQAMMEDLSVEEKNQFQKVIKMVELMKK